MTTCLAPTPFNGRELAFLTLKVLVRGVLAWLVGMLVAYLIFWNSLPEQIVREQTQLAYYMAQAIPLVFIEVRGTADRAYNARYALPAGWGFFVGLLFTVGLFGVLFGIVLHLFGRGSPLFLLAPLVLLLSVVLALKFGQVREATSLQA